MPVYTTDSHAEVLRNMQLLWASKRRLVTLELESLQELTSSIARLEKQIERAQRDGVAEFDANEYLIE